MARQLPPLSPLGVHIANTSIDRPQSRAMVWITTAIVLFPCALLLGAGLTAWAVKVFAS